ncbi:uncharacterized protein N7511_000164 [Penicillium nucicola]|uniref:uncharacterized protein n=1 Tax=Penicillium nucicola TaxID=1850975 RepID=UPI0025451C46|nr:uncharacterized protein N7511_000164 [Penicillium nucicola]KAJ5775153.1 hypothetical protein N7511_000164 [Penicillium nucicola]
MPRAHPPTLNNRNTTSSRIRADSPGAGPAITIDSSDCSESSKAEDEWPIKSILEETDTQYLIDWEGPYEPSWEPKENASEPAIEAWERWKARNTRGSPIFISSDSSRDLEDSSSSSSSYHSLSQNQDQSPEQHVNQTPNHCRIESHIAAQLQSEYLNHLSASQEQDSQVSASLFVNQGNLPEILESIEARIQQNSVPALASLHYSLDYSQSRNRSSSFETVSDYSQPPAKLLPGESQGVNLDDSLQNTQEQGDSTHSLFLAKPLSSEIEEVGVSNTPQTTQEQRYSTSGQSPLSIDRSEPPRPVASAPLSWQSVKSPGTFKGFKSSEIAETPAHPPSAISNISFDTPNLRSTLISQPFPSRSLLEEVEFSEPKYFGTIPETIFHPSQKRKLSGETFDRPRASFSNIFATRLSSQTMDENDNKSPLGELPGSTPRERIRNAWAQLNAPPQFGETQMASGIDTPSSVGDIEASIPVSVPEATAPLSVRAETDPFSHTAVHHAHSSLLPPSELAHSQLGQPSMQTIHPSALTATGMEEVVPGSVYLGPSEFAVTLPMDSRVKDDYERVLADAASSIRRFFVGFQSDSQISASERRNLEQKMQEVVMRLNNVSTHPDLNIATHLADSNTDPEKEASWAEYSSAKFLFLGHLMDTVETHELHVIIAVQHETTQAVIERYLLGKGFAYTRPREDMGRTLEVSMSRGPLSFGIHSSESVRELYKPPSAIFAFDASFNPKSPSMQHIRTTYARNGNLLPVIWFLVANTSEHIQRCLPDLTEPERLRWLVHYIARFHDEVGDLQHDALGIHENAEEILTYLLDGVAGWPLATIEPLAFVSKEELEASTPSSGSSLPQPQKRSLDDEGEDYTSKRARVDTQDNSQLTESTKPPSQTLYPDLESLEKVLIQTKHAHATEKEQLQAELAQVRAQAKEMEQAFGNLQHRFETRTEQVYTIRKERDSLVATTASLQGAFDKSQHQVLVLKEERKQLRQELHEARETIKAGGGSAAELEMTREEMRRLNAENEDLTRKASYEAKRSEYTREQYQTASTAAAQSGNESRLLTSENEELKRKADLNKVKLREMNINDNDARHLAKIDELNLTLAAREELLRRKEEELREIRKNRPSTRSTSTQPRSPKISASSRPTSPGVGHNGNGHNGGLPGRGSALRFSSEMRF